jgi:DivIVA domain-containing protein
MRSLIYLLVRVAGSLMSGKRATIVGMGQLFIVLAVALVAAALVFGVTVLIMGGDQGLEPAEPDSRMVPLPGSRPLTESDVGEIRFDITLRGYRMAQVDQALRRAGYDLGYKEELIGVLEAEVDALRSGRLDEADALRAARETAARPGATAADDAEAVIELGLAGADPSGADPAGAESSAADPDGAEPAGEASEPVVAVGEPGDDRSTPGGADRDAGHDEPVEGAADLDGRWPAGFGKLGDPAAAEPAK